MKGVEDKISELYWVAAADRLYIKVEEAQEYIAQLKSKIEALDIRIAHVEQEQKAVDSYPRIDLDIQAVMAAHGLLTHFSARIEELNKDIVAYERADAVEYPDVRQDLRKIKSVSVLLEKETSVNTLIALVAKYFSAVEEVERYPKQLDKMNGQIDQLKEKQDKVTSLIAAIIAVRDAYTAHDGAILAYDRGKTEYEQKMKAVGVCPLCNKEM